MKEEHKQYKYLFNAELGQLLIKTGITCQISATWKRSEETAKTDAVEFANGTANFNQTLSLPVKMYLNTNTKLYEEKKSQITFTLHSGKGDKSAGTIKIDLAKILNDKKQEHEETYVLEKCPDPQASIKIKLQAELLGQQNMDKQRMSDNQSINTSMSSLKIDDLPQHSIYSGGQQLKPKTQTKLPNQTSLPDQKQKQYLRRITQLQRQNSRLTMQNRAMHQSLIVLQKQQSSTKANQRKMSQDIQMIRQKSEQTYRNMIDCLHTLI